MSPSHITNDDAKEFKSGWTPAKAEAGGIRYGFPKLPPTNLIQTHAVPVNHPKIGIWNHIKEQTATLVIEEKIKISSVSVLMMRGSDDPQPSATIVINTPHLNSSLCSHLTFHI